MKYLVFIPAIIFTVLFHNQDIGMNLPVASLILLVTQLIFLKDLRKQIPWILNSSFIIILACSLFYAVNDYKVAILLLLQAVNMYISFSPKTTLGPGLIFTIGSVIITPIVDLFTYEKPEFSESQNKKPMSKLFVGLIVAAIFLVFLGLYSVVNQTLSDVLGDFFSQFSILWVFLLCLFSYITYSWLFPTKDVRVMLFEKDFTTEIKEKNKSIFETNIFKYTVICLIFLLGFVVSTDFYEIMHTSSESQSRAKYIHLAATALFVSILLVAGIVLLLNRKDIFNKSKGAFGLKNLTLIWLGLNVLLILTVVIKNYQYISAGGLTYLRIGVYYWLVACALLIFVLMHKILKNKSSWYAFNRMNWAAICILALSAIIPADKLILQNNLSRFEQNLDYDKQYLKDLIVGNELFFQEHPEILDIHFYDQSNRFRYNNTLISLQEQLSIRQLQLNRQHNKFGWRSMDLQSYWFLESIRSNR